jgi:Ni,Fe-hydrogenase III large subunit
MHDLLPLQNVQSVPSGDVPLLDIEKFREAVIGSVEAGARLSALFGHPAEDGQLTLLAVLADDRAGELRVGSTVVGASYESLTNDCPQAQGFEREIAEQWGVEPKGHPWLKPIRFQTRGCVADVPSARDEGVSPSCVAGILPASSRLPVAYSVFSASSSSLAQQQKQQQQDEGETPSAHAGKMPATHAGGTPAPHDASHCGVADFFQVKGEEIHEVAVGPVHAGVIEPGHFRFQCHGENVLHLEISLGYQHRGVERAMMGGPAARSIHYMETLAGDTTIGHATAYCQLLEAMSGCHVSAKAQTLRGVALELERAANHVGDLGALAGDVGFLPTASYCGRIRGDVLNLTALLCGSRFGRGMVRPGGVGFDVDASRVEEMLSRLSVIAKDTAMSVNLLWETPSVQARFEGTGQVTAAMAEQIGLVGPAARASGLERDVRQHHPYGIYRFAHIPIATWDTGDVFARAYLRWLEIQRSLAFVSEQLRSLPEDSVMADAGKPAGDHVAVSMVEGWRGEICHVAMTDDQGRFSRYKVTDPSFHNWFGLACAMRNQPISDFPVCNKSFNLSYCGHDL